MSRKIVNFKI